MKKVFSIVVGEKRQQFDSSTAAISAAKATGSLKVIFQATVYPDSAFSIWQEYAVVDGDDVRFFDP